MINLKFIARLIIGMMLSMLVLGSAFSLDPLPCSATSPGPDVNMFEKAHTQSTVVNILTVDDIYRIADINKLPSELEPEGTNVLWLFLAPADGTASGWVLYSEVVVVGDNCDKFGL